MSDQRQPDARDAVDGIVNQHQLQYSLVQLRLVGILLLLLVLGRLLVLAALSLDTQPLQRLAALTSVSGWLMLLPLGISLYLLGGGRTRQPKEFLFTDLAHHSLLPLALICLLVLPALTIQDLVTVSGQQQVAQRSFEAVKRNHESWREQARSARSSSKLAQLARDRGVQVPIVPSEPVQLSVWRFERALDLRLEQARQEQPLASLSPFERDLLSPLRSITSILLDGIAGIGLVLLDRQSRREIRRHGLSPSLFFRADPVRRLRRRRRFSS